jgi:hypothetical protein
MSRTGSRFGARLLQENIPAENLVEGSREQLQNPVRRLAQPRVLKLAGLAALLTALLCGPRLALWSGRSLPLWYLEACLALGCVVLWAFVFGWHTEYTGLPVITLKIKPSMLALATAAGVSLGLGWYLFLDPTLRQRAPDNYPDSYDVWFARVLFTLSFLQLFLTFAPFAWLIRLIRNHSVAIVMTVLFGVMVLSLKHQSLPTPMPTPLFAVLVIMRIVTGFLCLWFYLRGGLILAWWWGFLIEARHLLSL